MICIDVLYMRGTLHADACAQIDGLVADPRFLGKGAIGGMAIGDQQNVLVDEVWQAGMQLRLRQRPFSGDEIEGLSRAVARHQDTDLLIRHATLAGMTAPAARRTRQMSRSLFRFEHIQFVRFSDAMQAMGPVRFCQR